MMMMTICNLVSPEQQVNVSDVMEAALPWNQVTEQNRGLINMMTVFGSGSYYFTSPLFSQVRTSIKIVKKCANPWLCQICCGYDRFSLIILAQVWLYQVICGYASLVWFSMFRLQFSLKFHEQLPFLQNSWPFEMITLSLLSFAGLETKELWKTANIVCWRVGRFQAPQATKYQ